ncbi:MAG: outer membrane beta-barrel protein, partial [Bacteroidales bacterium]|nr:outer membrane beta-barrel protein [Bacteroidales bacterium]
MRKNYQILSIVLLTLIFFIPSILVSQNANRHEGKDKLVYQWYLNINGGITQAYGDIVAGSWHGEMLGGDKMGFGGGLRLGKHISPVFGVYGTVILSQLKGESGKDTKNMYFETDMLEYYLGGTLSLSNLIGGYKPRLVNVYLTAGIGLMYFTPHAYYRDTDPPVEVIPNTEKPDENWDNTFETMVPTGAGIDFRLNDRWDINVETTIRWMDSDKLDGYKNRKKGDEKNDAYFFT